MTSVEDLQEQFAAYIDQLRRAEGLSFTKLAKRLSWNPNFVVSILLHRRSTSLRSMSSLALAVGYRIDVTREDTTILLTLVKIVPKELSNA